VSSEGTPETAGAEEVWTVKKVLDWTIGHLKQHGSESPSLLLTSLVFVNSLDSISK